MSFPARCDCLQVFLNSLNLDRTAWDNSAVSATDSKRSNKSCCWFFLLYIYIYYFNTVARSKECGW